MLMNSMAIGKMWELLNLSGKRIWNTLIQTMPWTAWDRHWKIYSRNLISPPNSFGEHAQIEDSLVVDGCLVDGTVKRSILSTEAQVRKGAVVEDSVIMSGAIIGQGAVIKRAIIGEGAHISEGVEIDGTEEVQVVGYNEVVGVPKDED